MVDEAKDEVPKLKDEMRGLVKTLQKRQEEIEGLAGFQKSNALRRLFNEVNAIIPPRVPEDRPALQRFIKEANEKNRELEQKIEEFPSIQTLKDELSRLIETLQNLQEEMDGLTGFSSSCVMVNLYNSVNSTIPNRIPEETQSLQDYIGKATAKVEEVKQEMEKFKQPQTHAQSVSPATFSATPASSPAPDPPAKKPKVGGEAQSAEHGRVFLSYRVSADEDLVERIYDKLRGDGVKVWIDKKCLPLGQPWEEGFADGLFNSDVFVPVLSKKALAPFASLEASSGCDNVLLEYNMALELKQRGRLRGIFPILVGEVQLYGDFGEGFGDFFKTGGSPTCPEVVVDAVKAKTNEHLFRNLGTYSLRKDGDSTVKCILADICKHQGTKLCGAPQRDAIDKVIAEVKKAASSWTSF